MNIGIILAGGIGSRFKSDKPKQYMKLNGKEIIEYTINAFKRSKKINHILCVLDANTIQEGRIEKKYDIKCIQGGDTRNASLKNALDYIKENYENVVNIFIHEAARPFITEIVINNYIDQLDQYDAVVTAVEITDSLAKKNGENTERADYHLIQAPEGFRFTSLYEDFKAESNITSTCHQLQKHRKIKYSYNFGNNLKITYPNDLFLAEQIIKYNYFEKNLLNNVVVKKEALVLLLGASGGLGKSVKNRFEDQGIKILSPSRKELNLAKISSSDLEAFCADNVPDIIINCAAHSINDEKDLIDGFEETFAVNVKSNLIILEFAKKINKKVNVVLLSSSSSTRGRQNITLYSSSKAALNSIVESQAEVALKNNVYINAILPEKINTPLIQKLHKKDIDALELLKVEDVVDAVIYYSFSNEYGKLTHLRCGL